MSNENEGFRTVRNTVVTASTLSGIPHVQLSALLGAAASVPLAGAVTLTAGENLVLSEAQLLQAAGAGLFLDTSAVSADAFLSVGPDTADNAVSLMALFGLVNIGDSVALKFPLNRIGDAGFVALVNDSVSYNHVVIQRLGKNNSYSNSFCEPYSHPESGIPQVQLVVLDNTAGAEIVSFNITNRGKELADITL